MRLLRERGLPAAVVASEERVVGIVGEEELIRHAAPTWMPADPERVRTTPVSTLMKPTDVALSAEDPLYRAVEIFRQGDFSILPVVDDQGIYVGVITRSDVMTGLFAAATPRSIGGLATPLGVYLTTGALRAGPGDIGLILAGAALAILYVCARFLVNLFAWAVESNFPGLPIFSVRLAGDSAYFSALLPWQIALYAVEIAVFFLLLRASPMSAIHAAEHKVVHAIEHGDELTLEKVAPMPRVHPRCGTNLMAAVFVLLVAGQILAGLVGSLPAVAWPLTIVIGTGFILVAALAARRRLGPLLQSLVTTRNPPNWLLLHAIKVGQQLLARFHENPAAAKRGVTRVWNMGLLQVALGAVATSYLTWLISNRFNLGLWP